ILLFIYFNQRKHKYIREKQTLETNYRQALLTTRLEIQEETFKTISQEIHDNIGQALSFVKLNINTVDVYSPEAAKEKLLESKNQLSQTIQDLRDLAKSLNPDFLTEIGLVGAIEQQLQLMQKTGLYQAGLSVAGDEYKNPLQKELVIFRVVQELLNNIVKHAEANAVGVVMQYKEDKLVITVTDNGRGFDTAGEAKTGKGLGLPNMLNRMSLINGHITINSAAAMGTTATIELPKQDA
ncbi:MAG TPA: ATP-binding protein, partial [Chitinophagaceae bacterium]|nr:ATP-binding protein [Chitinophagaceae bacterium]